MTFGGSSIQRWSLRGAVVGAILAGLIAYQYWAAVRGGIKPAGAGYGAGILTWLASAPIGLIVLYVIVLPLMSVLGLGARSATLNMAAILIFGVIANWVGIGLAIGLIIDMVRKGIFRQAGLAAGGEHKVERTETTR